MTTKTTVEKRQMYIELAEEMEERGGRTNSAADFRYAAYNQNLKLQSEAEVLYMIDEYPDIMIHQ